MMHLLAKILQNFIKCFELFGKHKLRALIQVKVKTNKQLFFSFLFKLCHVLFLVLMCSAATSGKHNKRKMFDEATEATKATKAQKWLINHHIHICHRQQQYSICFTIERSR